MSTRFRFSKGAQAIIAATLAASMAASPVTALACTQVYIGDQLTTDGDTYWGRSEDYSNRYGKAFGIEPATESGKTIQSYENGTDPADSFTCTIDGPTFRYTYVRDTPDNWTDEGDAGAKAYSEAGTNEKGVSVSATLTTDYNDKIKGVDPLVDTGIGEYSATDYVLSLATSARDGVERLGKLVDQVGSQGCNQIVIGDATETWIFMQLSGHQWAAIKCANDVVSVNPNMDDLQFAVDLDDASVCLHSAGLVDTAQRAGTYTETDGKMNIAASYGSDSKSQGAGQNTRYVQGHKYFGENLVAGTDYTTNEILAVATIANPQLFFTPAEKVDPLTALRSVTARGEGTDVDANKNDKLYAIGNNRNTESHIFQVRDELAGQPDVATIQWESLSRGEFSIFVPSYSALLTEVDPELYPTEDKFDVTHVGHQSEYGKERDDYGNRIYDLKLVDENEKTALEYAGNKYLDYVFMDLNTLSYNHRKDVADGVHDYLMVLQQEIIDQQKQVDDYMLGTAAEERTELANKAHDVVSEEVYAKSSALLNEVRAYIKAGDTSTPFAASDLKDGKLATPLDYTVKIVPPTIVEQPSSLDVYKDSAAAALSVVVNDPAGSKLTYEWFKSADGVNWSSCGTSDTYVPQTTTIGTTSYKVVVTNAKGLATESEVATVNVAEAPEEMPVGSMYRLYNRYSGEHFYTASFDEMLYLVGVGWTYEGIGWKAPESSQTPVYRLYNPYAGDHHYTTSEAERDQLKSVGWNYEGVGWYSDDAQGVPLYRQYNPNATVGTHNYTTSKYENDALVNAGWNAEGIGWYGIAE